MNAPLYRATMLTGMATLLRLVLGNSVRPIELETSRTCANLCEAMESMAREEEKHSKTSAYDGIAEAVHASYALVQPPYVMLTDAEKIKAFDLLRAKLYPNGQDPVRRSLGG